MVDNGPPGTSSKKITPLVWIILAALVVLGAILVFGPSHIITTPSGRTVPAAAPATGPATGQAPDAAR